MSKILERAVVKHMKELLKIQVILIEVERMSRRSKVKLKVNTLAEALRGLLTASYHSAEYDWMGDDDPSPWDIASEALAAYEESDMVEEDRATCSNCIHGNEGDGYHGIYCELNYLRCGDTAKCDKFQPREESEDE